MCIEVCGWQSFSNVNNGVVCHKQTYRIYYVLLGTLILPKRILEFVEPSCHNSQLCRLVFCVIKVYDLGMHV